MLGIDLTSAPSGHSRSASGSIVSYRYASVQLRLTDGVEFAEGTALVGFAPLRQRYALLGRAGFHQFFDVSYRGEAREVVIQPNGAFSGTYVR